MRRWTGGAGAYRLTSWTGFGTSLMNPDFDTTTDVVRGWRGRLSHGPVATALAAGGGVGPVDDTDAALRRRPGRTARRPRPPGRRRARAVPVAAGSPRPQARRPPRGRRVVARVGQPLRGRGQRHARRGRCPRPRSTAGASRASPPGAVVTCRGSERGGALGGAQPGRAVPSGAGVAPHGRRARPVRAAGHVVERGRVRPGVGRRVA